MSRLTTLRRRLAEVVLPGEYFVQHTPNLHPPDFHQDSGFFNSVGQDKVLRDGNRWLSINLLLDLVRGLPEGDYAELGTYRGSTARLIWNRRVSDTVLYCFDTFTGFGENDEFAISGVTADPKSFSRTSVLGVQGFLKALGHEQLRLRVGTFPETFRGLESKPWRFVHLDCDLYAPTKAGLTAFWPSLVPGGVLLIHDYNAGYRGVKKAVDEFFDPLGIVPVPLCDKVGSCVVIKNKKAPL